MIIDDAGINISRSVDHLVRLGTHVPGNLPLEHRRDLIPLHQHRADKRTALVDDSRILDNILFIFLILL